MLNNNSIKKEKLAKNGVYYAQLWIVAFSNQGNNIGGSSSPMQLLWNLAKLQPSIHNNISPLCQHYTP